MEGGYVFRVAGAFFFNDIYGAYVCSRVMLLGCLGRVVVFLGCGGWLCFYVF